MVGEMRDEETVAIGVRAAITGHLVLSTLHTNDCASTIHRLRNMGVPPYMAAASLSGIIAQSLSQLPSALRAGRAGAKDICEAGETYSRQAVEVCGLSSLRGYGIYREDSGL